MVIVAMHSDICGQFLNRLPVNLETIFELFRLNAELFYNWEKGKIQYGLVIIVSMVVLTQLVHHRLYTITFLHSLIRDTNDS